MKLVDRQIMSEMVGPFVFGVAAFSSVFFSASVLPKVTQWLMNGMPIKTALELALYSLPSIVFWTLPMSTLLAVLMGIGRLSGESEVVALFAGGVSFYRIALPVLGLGLAISAFSMVLNEVAGPIANSRFAALEAEVFKSVSISDQPFTVEDTGTNSRIMVQGGMDKVKGILRDVTIVQFVSNRPALIVYASRAEWAGIQDRKKRYRWKLYDGYSTAIVPSNPQSIGTSTWQNAQTREVEIKKTPDELSEYQNLKPEQMSFKQLSKMVRIVKEYPDRSMDKIRQLDVDRWNKLAVPLTSLVFALLAAPLGIRPHRSSSSVGLGMSILVIFLYWIVGRYTWSLGVQGSVAPAVGAFAPLIIGVAVAAVLLKRAAK